MLEHHVQIDFDNPDLAILQKLLTLETCNLCHVPLKSSEEVKKHYRSKSHENLVIYWFGQVLLEKSRTFLNESVYEEDETNDQHTKNNIRSYANITKKSLGSTTSSTNKNTKNKAVETKLKSLTQPFYCHICPADLQTPKHAMAHYSSQKHAQKIEKWHKENGDVTAEISITNTGNMVSIDNNIEEDEIQELVNELSQPVFCFICKVNLGAKTVKAKTHYDSELHTMTENLCKQKIKKLMKNQDHQAISNTTSDSITAHDIVQDELKELMQLKHCYICKAKLNQPTVAKSHYDSKRHANNVDERYRQELKTFSLIQDKLNKLVRPFYCFLCQTNLKQSGKAEKHYNSKTHTKMIKFWQKNKKISMFQNPRNKNSSINTSTLTLTASNNRLDSNLSYLKTPQDIFQEKLNKLCQPLYCYLCQADLKQPGIASQHYNSKKHLKKINAWEENEKQNISHNLKNEETVSSSSSILIKEVKNISVDALIQEKLSNLTQPLCCYLCQVNLKLPGNAQAHYNSKKHSRIVNFWQEEERKRMTENLKNKKSFCKSSRSSNDVLNTCREVQEVNTSFSLVQNVTQDNFIKDSPSLEMEEVKSIQDVIQEKLNKLAQPHYCYLCLADVKAPKNAQSHYNSQKHANKVISWKEKEKKSITENYISNISPNSREQEIITTSSPDQHVTEDNINKSVNLYNWNDFWWNMNSSFTREEVKRKAAQYIIEEKLNTLIQPLYCFLCQADLNTPGNAESHYNSQKHTNEVIAWKEREKKSMTEKNLLNAGPYRKAQEIPNTSSSVQHVTEDNINKSVKLYSGCDFWCNMETDNQEVEGFTHIMTSSKENSSFKREDVKIIAPQNKIEETLNKLIQPLYCFLCQADLNAPGNAESHYNSRKHTNKVIAWKEKEKKSMTENDILNISPNSKEQEIIITSSPDQYVPEENINKSVKSHNWCDFWCNMETDNQEVEGFTHIMTSSKENSSFKREDVKIIAPQNIIEETLNKLIQPLYCFLCQADLNAPGNAESHYNSRKHTNKVIAWKEKEKKSMTENDILNISPNSKEQEIIITSSPDQYVPEENINKSVKSYNWCDFWCNMETDNQEIEILNTSVPVQHVTGDKTKKLDNQINGVPQIMPSSSTESSSVNKAEVKDVPDNEVIQEEVTKPFYCSMCQVDFRAAVNAQSHYNSRKHLKKLNSCQKKEESITEMDVMNTCKVDEVNISFSPVQQVAQIDQTSLENKLFDDADIETFHADLTRTFNIDIKKQLFDLLTEENCRICDILLSNQNSSKYHYLSKKHGKKIQQWHQNYQTDCQMEVVEGTVPQCDDSLPTTITLYCYICKCTFSTEELRKQHIQDLIHQGQLKVIIVLIKKEVPLHDEWFNLVRNVVQYDRCNMCLQRFSAFTSEAFEHINSPSFTDEIEMWIDQQKDRIPNDVFENVDTKVYYCEVCDAKLDGTTRTALHYTGKKHEESLQTYCQLCQLRLLTIENYEAHLQSPQHLEISAANEEKVTEETICLGLDHANKHESNPQISYKDTLEPDLSKNDLDDKLLQELEKLTDALYYSKNIPLERALKFIQKFNKELAQDIQENMEMLLSVDNKTDIKEASVLKTNFEEENLAFSSKSYRGAINNLEPVEIFVDNSNHNIKEETSVSVECNQVCEQNVVVCSPDHNLSKQLNESPLEKNKIIAIEESTLDLHINNTREGLIRDDLNQVEIIDDLNHNIKEETKECVKKSSKKKRRKRKQLENSDNVECNEVSEQNIFISPDYNISKELSEIRSHLEVNQIKTIIKESTSDSHINNLREGPIGEDLKRVEIIDLDDSNHNIVEENEVVDKKSCKRKRVRRGGRGRRKLLETGDNDECNQSCSEKDTNTSQDQNISKINIHTETDDIGINSEANTTVSYEANILKPDTISMKRIEGCLSLKQKVSRELTYEMIAQGILDNRYFNKDHYRPINLDKTIDYNVDASTSKSAEIDFDASSSEQSQQGSFTEDEIQEKENGYCNEQTKTEEKRICRIS